MLMTPPPGYSPSAINQQVVQPLGVPGQQGLPGHGTLGASTPYGSSLGTGGLGHMAGVPAAPHTANIANMTKALGS